MEKSLLANHGSEDLDLDEYMRSDFCLTIEST